jgi:hypothetical protein
MFSSPQHHQGHTHPPHALGDGEKAPGEPQGAVHGDTSFVADEECAVGGRRRLGFYDKTIKEKGAQTATLSTIP